MQAALALTTAFMWGSGNFIMGLASKKGAPRLAVFIGFTAGLIAALLFAAIQRPGWDTASFTWGVFAGVAQGIGWAVLSYALMIGRIAVVMPVASTATSALLYAVGVGTGDSITFISLAGALLALSAVVCLTTERRRVRVTSGGESEPRSDQTRRASLLALVVAGCFAAQALLLDRAGDDATSLVMIGARFAVVLLVGASFLVRPIVGAAVKPIVPISALGGLIILVGDVVYLLALDAGPLTVAGVLSGVHPAFTIVLATLVLRERLHPVQAIGVGLALVGSTLLSLG